MKKYLILLFGAFCLAWPYYYFIGSNHFIAYNNYTQISNNLKQNQGPKVINKQLQRQVYKYSVNMPKYYKMQDPDSLHAIGLHYNIRSFRRYTFVHSIPNYFELPHLTVYHPENAHYRDFVSKNSDFDEKDAGNYYYNIASNKRQPCQGHVEFLTIAPQVYKENDLNIYKEPISPQGYWPLLKHHQYKLYFNNRFYTLYKPYVVYNVKNNKNNYILKCQYINSDTDNSYKYLNYIAQIDLKEKHINQAIISYGKKHLTIIDHFPGMNWHKYTFDNNTYYLYNNKYKSARQAKYERQHTDNDQIHITK